MAQHICASCWQKISKKLEHTECSSACPHSVNLLGRGEVLLLSNLLIDIFLPSYCNKKFSGIVEKPSREYMLFPQKKCVCIHSKNCQICSATKSVSLTDTFEMLDIHKQVKHSGKHNFEGAQFP